MNEKFETIIKTKTKEYYTNNNKNKIFKSNQKIELAKTITESINLSEYLKSVIYIDTVNHNHIFTSYPKLKPIMHPDNFDSIVKYVDILILKVLETYDHYFMHVDIFSLTISGTQRTMPLIHIFLTKSMSSTSEFYRIDKMNKTYIYNSPKIIQNIRCILEPILGTEIINKIVYVN